MDKIKLKWRIFSFLLGFCALLIIMLWLFQTVFLFDMYKFVRSKEIDSAISYINKNINNHELPSILNELMNEKEIMVTKTNDFAPPPVPARDDRTRRMQETVTKTKIFTLDNGTKLSLTFHAIITPVNATVNTIKLQLYVITGIMIAMSVTLAIIIAKKISRPIEDINKSAKILSKGNYDVIFNAKNFLEISELSDTLNAMAKELSKVESLRRELMANVSHDLRTPLSLIYSYAEMMHDFPEEISQEQSQIIMDETKRLSSLVNDILDFTKIEKGLESINKTKFNITEALRIIIYRTSKLVEQKGYSINFEYEREYFVYADEVKISQAFYNMVINAINYCGDDKCIEIIQYISDDDKLKIDIVDHGQGISSEELPYIWDRYYKSDKSHKRGVTGSGLGLSIVKKIFELHNIEYGVDSELGRGSVFWFKFDSSELQNKN